LSGWVPTSATGREYACTVAADVRSPSTDTRLGDRLGQGCGSWECLNLGHGVTCVDADTSGDGPLVTGVCSHHVSQDDELAAGLYRTATRDGLPGPGGSGRPAADRGDRCQESCCASCCVGQMGSHMTYLEAALYVLRSAKCPLTTREITERAMKSGLISPRGKTPAATMSAVLYKALNAHRGIVKVGESDSYVRVKVGESYSYIRARRGTVRWTTN
jgi:hypothetical protein